MVYEKARMYAYLSAEITSLYHEAAVKIGISDTVLNILYVLCEKEGQCLQRDIFRLTGISRQTINSAIRKLERDGIAYLKQGEGRNTMVCLTKKGSNFSTEKILPLFQIEEKGYYKTHGCSDSFTCKVCGRLVVPTGAGSNHRNHCPNCLSSLHLDIEPGDREADCGGIMEPVGVWVRKNGEWALIHRCRRCGHLSSNRVAADDNPMKLMSIAMKPLSQPPFPLEKIEEMTTLMGGDGQLSYG